MKILDYINQKTNNAYKDFKLVSVIFDENLKELTFKFLYKDTIKDDDKDILQKLIKSYIPEEVSIVIKCKKAYVDCDLVKDVIHNFIIRNFASIGVDFDKNNINVEISDWINVEIFCTDFQYKYLDNPQNNKEILDYAEGFFFEPFNLKLSVINQKGIVDESILNNTMQNLIYSDDYESKIKYNKITNLNSFIGEVIGNPIQIACISGSIENIEIVGNVNFLNEKSFESKRKDKNGEATIKSYYSFNLNDSSGKINCVYFPTKADIAKASMLQEGMTVLVHGNVEEFNGRVNFKVKSIATCEILEEIETEPDVEIIKEPNKDYIFVKPQPYIEMFQDNLFMQRDEVGQYLLDNDVVVFDIETTGLEATRCEILEIGAVKLHKGKIAETFETLIKPSVSIPEEIIELTGITDNMVVNAPNIKQVMPDFYKFCYGTTIMAYNIDFDYKFISIYGKKFGYEFDMKQIDAMFLARAYIPGLKNFKLSTVCKKLGVSLENAHRAVHDATATAEVVIKLSTNIT